MAARGRFFGKDSRQIIVVAEKRSDTTRDLLSRTYDPESRNKIIETDLGWSRDVWSQLADTGILSLGFEPDEAGQIEIVSRHCPVSIDGVDDDFSSAEFDGKSIRANLHFKMRVFQWPGCEPASRRRSFKFFAVREKAKAHQTTQAFAFGTNVSKRSPACGTRFDGLRLYVHFFRAMLFPSRPKSIYATNIW